MEEIENWYDAYIIFVFIKYLCVANMFSWLLIQLLLLIILHNTNHQENIKWNAKLESPAYPMLILTYIENYKQMYEAVTPVLKYLIYISKHNICWKEITYWMIKALSYGVKMKKG